MPKMMQDKVSRRSCFRTKEYNPKNLICKNCEDIIECGFRNDKLEYIQDDE